MVDGARPFRLYVCLTALPSQTGIVSERRRLSKRGNQMTMGCGNGNFRPLRVCRPISEAVIDTVMGVTRYFCNALL